MIKHLTETILTENHKETYETQSNFYAFSSHSSVFLFVIISNQFFQQTPILTILSIKLTHSFLH